MQGSGKRASENSPGLEEAGEGKGRAVGGYVRIGKDQGLGKKTFLLNFVGERLERN